jgi:hypothetical protein
MLPAAAESAGTKTPFSRNCFIFDMRSNDEADGERRMIGSRRLPVCPVPEGFLRFETRAGFVLPPVGVGPEVAARDLLLRPR